MLAVSNNIPVIDITAATADDVSDQDDPPMMISGCLVKGY
jgi:hypothetical protein